MAEVKKRDSLKRSIYNIYNQLKNHPAIPIKVSLDVLEKDLESKYEKAAEVHFLILPTCTDDAGIVLQEQEMDKITLAYYESKTKFEELRLSTAPPPPPAPPVKLPRVELPKFQGTYESWPSFSDLFKASIDNNKSLCGSQKLQYLLSCCEGEASQLISSFTITDANFKQAWMILEARYDNKREIIYSLITKLINQKPVKQESAANVQQLYNTTTECIRQLKVLGQPVDTWDAILSVIIIGKLDSETKAEWAKSLKGTAVPTFQEVQDFLEQQIRVLLARGSGSNSQQQGKFQRQPVKSNHASTTICAYCKESHSIMSCKAFKDLSPEDRYTAVAKRRLCSNCLGGSHFWKTCDRGSCRSCGKKHHSLLHEKFVGNHSSANQASTSDCSQAEVGSNHAAPSQACRSVLLKTAMVDITTPDGKTHPCRVLLDDGSEATFMRTAFARAIGIHRTRADVRINGIGGLTAAHSKWKVNATLKSRVYDAALEIEALLLPKVTGTRPRIPSSMEVMQWPHLQKLQLADPNFTEPGEIDVLIGSDELAGVLREGLRSGPRHSPAAQHTIFGWVLSGKVCTTPQSIITVNHASCNLEKLVERFWEVERVPAAKPQTPEEADCEAHFTTTHTRNTEGRYIVRLPFNSNINKLGDSKEFATKRLLQLERRFKRHPQQHQLYREFMKEYLQLGHMEEVADSPDQAYYIPHHFVYKEDSTTTKLRVVFDASMKTTSGFSLNDALKVGPTVQDSLFSLLLRFRTYPIALKADIAKMYRQFLVHHADRDFQRILWRDSPEENIKCYRLCTVTYGTACAPYLATRCLNQLASDEGADLPAAAEALTKSVYVDDYLGGAKTVEEATELYHQLTTLCSRGQLKIRKWCSNSNDLLKIIPLEDQETHSATDLDSQSMTVKALGIRWDAQQDVFYFAYKPTKAKTKRDVLSEIATTFDPLGLISPVTITAKITMQELWKAEVGWDDDLPTTIFERWQQYQHQLENIPKVKIKRCAISPQAKQSELHCFSDASENAYAAAFYIQNLLDDGSTEANLLCSRTKVAPLKQLSIPRLELCGTHLVAETLPSLQTMKIIFTDTFAWTDSMVTLQWITRPSRNWKTYVANRVAAIQEVLPPSRWHHVNGEENPADLPSRGIPASSLINNRTWWHGPPWLLSGHYPISTAETDMNAVTREEKTSMLAQCNNENEFVKFLQQFSSLEKLITTIAWLTRFAYYLRKNVSKSKVLTPGERHSALVNIIHFIQQQYYPNEISRLQNKQPVPVSSKLAKLTPFLDDRGLLRVGGRLTNAHLHFNSKHQLILPNEDNLVILLIRHYHLSHLHGGYQLVMTNLQRKYHIIGGKSRVRDVIRNCVKCRRLTARTLEQQMGNLPLERVTPSRPFLHAGVDFAGPFLTKTRTGRGSKLEKSYMAIFVCFATKACHLEVVSSLSGEAFLAAYKRFVSRRGVCVTLTSDCGTNFIKADKELRKMLTEHQVEFQQHCAKQGTTFQFHPPSAPHRNGLSEAAVKSAKHHLRRVLGTEHLTFEQLSTLLCNIEAILNSRPLCPLTDSNVDVDALTPGHFLVGQPLTAVPDPSLALERACRLDQWRRIQQMTHHLWKRWSQDYLITLQQRQKWNRRRPNLQVGDLVVIQDDCLPPMKWRLGRVIQAEPSPDGLVRKVTLKTATGEMLRPIQKLSLLLKSNKADE